MYVYTAHDGTVYVYSMYVNTALYVYTVRTVYVLCVCVYVARVAMYHDVIARCVIARMCYI